MGRALVACVAIAVATAGVSAPRSSAGAATVERIAGADRYETAAAVSRAAFPDGAPVVFLASGTVYADALAAAPAAAAAGGPVLLTAPDALPSATQTELGRLHPATVVVVGGADAISDAVAAAAGATQRVAGADRYETATALARRTHPGDGPVDTAYLASGTAFADGLAGAVLAAADRAPVLLSPAACMPDVIAAEIDRLAPQRLVVLGGESAVGAGALARATCRRPHDPRPVSREQPVNVLMLGDSTATAPAYSLTRMLGDLGGVAASDKAIGGGTGFARPDVLDWVAYSRQVMVERDPDIATMIIGANDGQGMTLPDGRVLRFGTDAWKAEYARRVGAAMDAIAVDGRMVIWMSEPPMGREPLQSEMMLIDDLVASVARTRDVVWLDTRPLFSGPNGEYVNNGWRTSDAVHFTVAGGDRLAAVELQLIRSRWGF